jgi:hypothetical protein
MVKEEALVDRRKRIETHLTYMVQIRIVVFIEAYGY